jgi:hypothetical protein
MREFYSTMSEQKWRRAGIHTCTAFKETAELLQLGYMVFKLGIGVKLSTKGIGINLRPICMRMSVSCSVCKYKYP